jgi:hypothetical protein
MNTTRIIVDGIPYKLVRVDWDIKVDDYCELCAIRKYCLKNDGTEDMRSLCSMPLSVNNPLDTADAIFAVDDDIDKTIREAMKEEI